MCTMFMWDLHEDGDQAKEMFEMVHNFRTVRDAAI